MMTCCIHEMKVINIRDSLFGVEAEQSDWGWRVETCVGAADEYAK